MEEESNANIFQRLRLFNLFMGGLHMLQGIAMLLLSNDFSVDIVRRFLEFDAVTQTAELAAVEVFSIKLGPATALFLFLSAFFHFLIASPLAYDWYKENLKRKINYARWYEYALSSSLMIVIIGALSGINDVSTLLAMFALNASMNLFGLLMELHNQNTEKTDWTSYIFGCFAGIIPWVVIGIYFFGAIDSVSDESPIPDFVYAILASIFVFFNVFALNMFLQYKKIGPWKSYLFGETMYIVLSLVAKSALAWQIFSGTLR